jgi:hypothetical protein
MRTDQTLLHFRFELALFPPTELAHQATVGVNLLLERSKLFESHW